MQKQKVTLLLNELEHSELHRYATSYNLQMRQFGGKRILPVRQILRILLDNTKTAAIENSNLRDQITEFYLLEIMYNSCTQKNAALESKITSLEKELATLNSTIMSLNKELVVFKNKTLLANKRKSEKKVEFLSNKIQWNAIEPAINPNTSKHRRNRARWFLAKAQHSIAYSAEQWAMLFDAEELLLLLRQKLMMDPLFEVLADSIQESINIQQIVKLQYEVNNIQYQTNFKGLIESHL